MVKPLQTSSGDLLADRRADYAEMLFASGDHAAAAELMTGALELAPDWSFGWFRLGEFHEVAGMMPAAVEAWRMAARLDPQDRVGAALKLQLAGADAQGVASGSGFAETLFDQYAPTFDTSLVGKLGYRVPELLADAIRAHAPASIDLAIDLGCGTGLMGERLRPIVKRLEGYDISAGMLKRAEAKGIYDRLTKADLAELSYAGDPAGLVVAADVVMYLGALDGFMALVRSMLGPSGIFAFSAERNEGPEPFLLRSSRRTAHAPAYLRDRLAAAGLVLLSMEEAVIRQDRGEAVNGLVIVASAPSVVG